MGSGNNKNYGVYSDYEASDTDYLSAQSGDFDELTICYQNERNIPFRNKAMMNRRQYFSDLGPSDIGSSDTDYLSDSIPPPMDHLLICTISYHILRLFVFVHLKIVFFFFNYLFVL